MKNLDRHFEDAQRPKQGLGFQQDGPISKGSARRTPFEDLGVSGGSGQTDGLSL